MGLTTFATSEVTLSRCPVKLRPRFHQFATARELEERNLLLLQHLPQVQFIASRIHKRLPRHVPLEDLVQSGVLGLIEALEKFDPSRNVQLQSYAKVRIRGAILDSLREQDWSPRTLRKKARQIEHASQSWMTRFGRAPSDPEIASQMRISLKKFYRLIGDLHGLEMVSLQAMSFEAGNGHDGARDFPQSTAERQCEACLRGEMSSFLRRAIGQLAPKSRQVLAGYYFEELTMKEVGFRLGVSESRVSQIHTACLSRLRARMGQLLASRRYSGPARAADLSARAEKPIEPGLCPQAAISAVKPSAKKAFREGRVAIEFPLRIPTSRADQEPEASRNFGWLAPPRFHMPDAKGSAGPRGKGYGVPGMPVSPLTDALVGAAPAAKRRRSTRRGERLPSLACSAPLRSRPEARLHGGGERAG